MIYFSTVKNISTETAIGWEFTDQAFKLTLYSQPKNEDTLFLLTCLFDFVDLFQAIDTTQNCRKQNTLFTRQEFFAIIPLPNSSWEINPLIWECSQVKKIMILNVLLCSKYCSV